MTHIRVLSCTFVELSANCSSGQITHYNECPIFISVGTIIVHLSSPLHFDIYGFVGCLNQLYHKPGLITFHIDKILTMSEASPMLALNGEPPANIMP